MDKNFLSCVKRYITITDLVIIFVILLISISILLLTVNSSGLGLSVIIESNGQVYGVYNINEDCDINVTSNYGTNTVCIRNKEVFVKNTSCPDKYELGNVISKSGQAIVCLPNRLIVKIEGSKTKIDGVTY